MTGTLPCEMHIVIRVIRVVNYMGVFIKCGSRGGGGGGQGVRTPPWKITSYMGFYRE